MVKKRSDLDIGYRSETSKSSKSMYIYITLIQSVLFVAMLLFLFRSINLSDQNTSISNTVLSQSTEINLKDNQINTLKKINEKLKLSNNEFEKKIDTLNRKANFSNEINDIIKEKVKELETKIYSLKIENDNQSGKTKKLVINNDLQADRIKELETKLDFVNTELNSANELIKKKNVEIKILNSELEVNSKKLENEKKYMSKLIEVHENLLNYSITKIISVTNLSEISDENIEKKYKHYFDKFTEMYIALKNKEPPKCLESKKIECPNQNTE